MAIIPPNSDISFLTGVKKVAIAKVYPEMQGVSLVDAVRGKLRRGNIEFGGSAYTITDGTPFMMPTGVATGLLFDRLAFQVVFKQQFYVECPMFSAGYVYTSSGNIFECWEQYETNYYNPSKPAMPSPPYTWGEMAVYNELQDPEWGNCYNFVSSSPGTGGLLVPSNYNGNFTFVEDYQSISLSGGAFESAVNGSVRYQVPGTWPPEYQWFPYFIFDVAVSCYTSVDTWPGDSMMWRRKYFGVNGPCTAITNFSSAGYRIWGVRDPGGGVPPKYINLHVDDEFISPGQSSKTFVWPGTYVSSEVYGGVEYSFGHIKFTIVMTGSNWNSSIAAGGYFGGGSFPGYNPGMVGAGRIDEDFSVGVVEVTPSQLIIPNAEVKDVVITY
jgi:hypothetical protein